MWIVTCGPSQLRYSFVLRSAFSANLVMNADNFATAGRAKARHYQKLASEMKKLAEGCDETRTLFERLQYDLQAMNTLAGLHGAQ